LKSFNIIDRKDVKEMVEKQLLFQLETVYRGIRKITERVLDIETILNKLVRENERRI